MATAPSTQFSIRRCIGEFSVAEGNLKIFVPQAFADGGQADTAID
jgi:hypothetical protein